MKPAAHWSHRVPVVAYPGSQSVHDHSLLFSEQPPHVSWYHMVRKAVPCPLQKAACGSVTVAQTPHPAPKQPWQRARAAGVCSRARSTATAHAAAVETRQEHGPIAFCLPAEQCCISLWRDRLGA